MATKHPHTKLVNNILRKLSNPNSKSRYFKNPVGSATYSDGSTVVYGLARGANDIIGFTTIKITEDMVGSNVAVFTGIEAKTGNATARKNQKLFIDAIKKAGGISGVAKSPEGAIELIKKWKPE